MTSLSGARRRHTWTSMAAPTGRQGRTREDVPGGGHLTGPDRRGRQSPDITARSPVTAWILWAASGQLGLDQETVAGFRTDLLVPDMKVNGSSVTLTRRTS